MTNEEAIERIRKRICCEGANRSDKTYHICTDECLYGEENCELALAIKALEKQIPKKRVPIDNFRFYCPSCKKMQIEDEEGWTIYYEFCPYCGQAISL